MALSKFTVSQIVQIVADDPESKSRVNSWLNKIDIADSGEAGAVRNFSMVLGSMFTLGQAKAFDPSDQAAAARGRQQGDGGYEDVDDAIHSWLRSVLDVIQAGAESNCGARHIAPLSACSMLGEPSIDPLQERLALVLDKLLKLRQCAYVDVIVDCCALEPGGNLRRPHEIVNVGPGHIGNALTPKTNEPLVHALRDVAALERFQPPIGCLPDRARRQKLLQQGRGPDITCTTSP